MNFEQLLAMFFKFRVLRPDTQITYKKIVHCLLKDRPAWQPDNVSVDDVLTWRTQVLSRIKPISWNTYCRHLHVLLRFGIEHDLLSRQDNPFAHMQARSDKKQNKAFTWSQIQEIEKFIAPGAQQRYIKFNQPTWFFAALIRTLLYTGMRRRQLLGLKIADINFEDGLIFIDADKSKNHSSQIIPIAAKLKPSLEKLVEAHRQRSSDTQEQLFNLNCFRGRAGNVGALMNEAQLDAIFRSFSDHMGFKISSHRFRHSMATRLLKNSNNIYVAQKILGHRSIQTTLGYVDFDIELLRVNLNTL